CQPHHGRRSLGHDRRRREGRGILGAVRRQHAGGGRGFADRSQHDRRAVGKECADRRRAVHERCLHQRASRRRAEGDEGAVRRHPVVERQSRGRQRDHRPRHADGGRGCRARYRQGRHLPRRRSLPLHLHRNGALLRFGAGRAAVRPEERSDGGSFPHDERVVDQVRSDDRNLRTGSGRRLLAAGRSLRTGLRAVTGKPGGRRFSLADGPPGLCSVPEQGTYGAMTVETLEKERTMDPAAAPRAAKLVVSQVSKYFHLSNGTRIEPVSNVSLEVLDNELWVLVGPSGCGKSAVLRMVGGLEEPSEGMLRLDGREILAPGRDRGMVFQSYTSFDWLTVQENVEYGLRLNRIPKAQRRERAAHFIDLVNLTKFRDAYP